MRTSLILFIYDRKNINIPVIKVCRKNINTKYYISTQSLPSVEYEYFDHTADIGLKAYGDSLASMFENAAKGMFSIMFETISEVDPAKVLKVELKEEENQEQLLIDWLNELLFLLETEDLVLSRFNVTDIGPKGLKAEVSGSPFDPQVHRYKTEVKSATYHMLEIGRENDKYFGRILFDI